MGCINKGFMHPILMLEVAIRIAYTAHMQTTTAQIILDVPVTLFEKLADSKDAFARQSRLWIALHLFHISELTTVQAAEMAGIDLASFLAEASHNGIPVVDYEPDELDQELELLATIAV